MKVAVTGSSGSIGRVLMAGLTDLGYESLGIDRVQGEAPNSHVADVSSVQAVADLITGCDAVVHLAAIPDERPFDISMASHLAGTHAVLEAMRLTEVPRMVLASSNHAVGRTSRAEVNATSAGVMSVNVRPRPDTFYGVAKVAADALTSLYVDRYQRSAVICRIGSFGDRPVSRRHLSTWLSPDDAVRMVVAGVTADVDYGVLYGISANTRAWWDLEAGRSLGYFPQDDAELWAAEIEATPETDEDRFEAEYVGGPYAGPEFDIPYGSSVSPDTSPDSSPNSSPEAAR